uniref:C2H2-type domain-containing protein n=1 Tax=Trichuris muris TaxID=70415 RepID=A0A5S6QA59_TRIMR
MQGHESDNAAVNVTDRDESIEMTGFSCPTCQRTFSRHSSLWNHLKIHSAQTFYTCNICEKTFKWKNSLRAHGAWHVKKGEICSVNELTDLKKVRRRPTTVSKGESSLAVDDSSFVGEYGNQSVDKSNGNECVINLSTGDSSFESSCNLRLPVPRSSVHEAAGTLKDDTSFENHECLPSNSSASYGSGLLHHSSYNGKDDDFVQMTQSSNPYGSFGVVNNGFVKWNEISVQDRAEESCSAQSSIGSSTYYSSRDQLWQNVLLNNTEIENNLHSQQQFNEVLTYGSMTHLTQKSENSIQELYARQCWTNVEPALEEVTDRCQPMEEKRSGSNAQRYIQGMHERDPSLRFRGVHQAYRNHTPSRSFLGNTGQLTRGFTQRQPVSSFNRLTGRVYRLHHGTPPVGTRPNSAHNMQAPRFFQPMQRAYCGPARMAGQRYGPLGSPAFPNMPRYQPKKPLINRWNVQPNYRLTSGPQPMQQAFDGGTYGTRRMGSRSANGRKPGYSFFYAGTNTTHGSPRASCRFITIRTSPDSKIQVFVKPSTR